jgi:phenylpropionate dioxygenase-like ring-hydroxylating dioxygenase large terminal subunit
MFARNFWYVAAWDHEVKRQELLRRVVLNEPIALYRTDDGVAVALQDRCCHRAMPLSSGRLAGNNVVCGYHGLVYDPTGACIAVPSQRAIPPNARVKSYPIMERYGWIWVWMGDPALADRSQIDDDFFWTEDPGWRFKGERVEVAGGYLLMVDNLLDLTHVQFVHPTTLGADGVAAAPIKTERDGNLIRVARWVLDKPASPFFQKVGKLTPQQPVDRWQIVEFRPPCFIRLDVGCAPSGTGAPQGDRSNGFSLRHHSIMTPQTERSCQYYWCEGHNFNIDDPSITDLLYRQLHVAIAEDLDVIQVQQANIDLDPDAQFVDFNQDSGPLQARRMVDAIVNAEARVTAKPAAAE